MCCRRCECRERNLFFLALSEIKAAKSSRSSWEFFKRAFSISASVFDSTSEIKLSVSTFEITSKKLIYFIASFKKASIGDVATAELDLAAKPAS